MANLETRFSIYWNIDIIGFQVEFSDSSEVMERRNNMATGEEYHWITGHNVVIVLIIANNNVCAFTVTEVDSLNTPGVGKYHHVVLHSRNMTTGVAVPIELGSFKIGTLTWKLLPPNER